MPKDSSTAVLRILDANLNRLREGLRVVEEYARFAAIEETITGDLRAVRHSLRDIEGAVGSSRLLGSRDVAADPLTGDGAAAELARREMADVCTASFRRAQEAARVLEEYLKVTDSPLVSNRAKAIRFSLYDLEKRVMELRYNGRE